MIGFLDWRTGAWLLVLGLLGLLLPTFGQDTPLPMWPFYVLLAIGVIVTGIGIYHALKRR
ncbi:hypothetical protein KAU45_05120 [bacterium]|nr:hypothetical protein [bacterium]